MQKNEFARIITLIRKEKGISQKQAAIELGISQALLSHYEKGVRECGLDFVIRVADYYDVSCDYLLGRSADRLGTTINVEEIPEANGKGDNVMKGSVLPTLNKKLILNSVNILYDILAECENNTLVTEMSEYIMDVVYKAFRYIYSANEGNASAMFRINEEIYPELVNADMLVHEAKIKACLGKTKSDLAVSEKAKSIKLSQDSISKNWPALAGSLLNLIKRVENNYNPL